MWYVPNGCFGERSGVVMSLCAADCEHPSIPVDSFTERIAMLRNDNGAGLEDEYAVSEGREGRMM